MTQPPFLTSDEFFEYAAEAVQAWRDGVLDEDLLDVVRAVERAKGDPALLSAWALEQGLVTFAPANSYEEL